MSQTRGISREFTSAEEAHLQPLVLKMFRHQKRDTRWLSMARHPSRSATRKSPPARFNSPSNETTKINMAVGGPIIGLDLGRLTGFAAGRPGEIPRSCTFELSKPRAGLAVQAGNLIAVLDREFRRERPAIVAKEAPFSLAAFSDHRVAEAVVRSAYGLHCIVEAVCQRWGIPCHEAAESTITKHFTGKGRHGGRAERKSAVLVRCRLLGYLPEDCKEEDRADACGVWDWACAHLARQAPRELVMFQGAAA